MIMLQLPVNNSFGGDSKMLRQRIWIRMLMITNLIIYLKMSLCAILHPPVTKAVKDCAVALNCLYTSVVVIQEKATTLIKMDCVRNGKNNTNKSVIIVL